VESEVRNTEFAKYIGCGAQDLLCMRSKTTAEALNASVQTEVILDELFHFTLEAILPWRPVISAEIPSQILTAFSSGAWNQVPIIIGANNDEGILFTYESFNFLDNAEYVAAITAIFKESALDVLEVYPTTWDPLKDVRGPISDLLTHYLFACPSRHFASLITNSPYPVWFYHFNRVSSMAYAVWGPNYQYCWDKVCHGNELVYVFDSAVPSKLNITVPDIALSEQIVYYWTNFARNSDPNKGNPVPIQWPQFNNQTKLNIVFDAPSLSIESWISGYCDFWDSQGYSF